MSDEKPAGGTPADERGGSSQPDERFSIPERRLAGSELCLNCGERLEGAYCHWCGQPDRRLKRFFPALLRDLAEDTLGLDSRLARTLGPLFFRPGRLTADYLDGKRSRFTPPLRLYLAASVVFFLLATLLPNDIVVVSSDDPEDIVLALSDGQLPSPENPPAELEAAREMLHGLEDGLAAGERPTVAGGAGESGAAERGAGAGPPGGAGAGEGEPKILVNGKPWNRETNPFEAAWLPGFVNGWINDEIEESPAKAKRIAENPRLFTDKMYEVLPASMFVLLPLAALLLKAGYPLSRRWYFEHLIFSLHQHAFVFLALAASLALGAAGEWAAPRVGDWILVLTFVAKGLVLFGLPLHFLLALKTVYGQGWFATFFKFGLLTSLYALLLLLATAVVALTSFVLL